MGGDIFIKEVILLDVPVRNEKSSRRRIDVDYRYVVDFGDKFGSIRRRFDVDIEPFLTGQRN